MAIPGPLMDPAFVASVQQFSPPLTAILAQAIFLDSMPWYFFILCLVTYGLHPRYGARLVTFFSLNSALNEAAKLFFHLPRPYWVSGAVKAFSAEGSFGFPSGAAEYGMVLYGYIATVVRRRWVIALCFILLMAASAARIFAGLHFPLDILGGWAIGLLLLVAFLYGAPKVEAFALALPRPARLALIVVVAAVPVMLVYLAYFSIGGWQVPEAWLAMARQQTGVGMNPASVQYPWSAAGLILGSLAGYEFLRSRGGWDPPADRKRRAVVVIAGTVSVLLLNELVTDALALPGLASLSPPVTQLLAMTAVSFWLIACVPSLAAKAGFT